MKTLCCTLLLGLLALAAGAQKIAVKKSLVTVDGQPYARLEPNEQGMFGESEAYYVSSLQNERVLLVKVLRHNDPANASPDNRYLQFVFTASRTVVETPFPTTYSLLRPIALARQLYAARLFKNGTLDPQAVADFSTNYGTPYSERQRVLNQPVLVTPTGY